MAPQLQTTLATEQMATLGVSSPDMESLLIRALEVSDDLRVHEQHLFDALERNKWPSIYTSAEAVTFTRLKLKAICTLIGLNYQPYSNQEKQDDEARYRIWETLEGNNMRVGKA